MSIQDSVEKLITRDTLAGRLPVNSSTRLYKGFSPVVWITTAFCGASWNYLIGASLGNIGNTKLAILGYTLGLIIGLVPVILAAGLIPFKHGADAVDAVKSVLGTRGAGFFLFFLMVSAVGWAFILIAMTSQAFGRAYQAIFNPGEDISNTVVRIVALSLLVLIWWCLRRGPALMLKLTQITSPCILIIAFILLVIVCSQFGLAEVLNKPIDPQVAYTQDPLLQLAYAVEFGIAASLSFLPTFGGIARLIKRRKDMVSGTFLGYALIGGAFTTGVATLAAVGAGSSEPAEWVLNCVGTVGGAFIIVVLLFANLGTMVNLIYISGVSVQQIRLFAKMRWSYIIALLLLPGVWVAFETTWLLAHVMSWLAYNGTVFVGMSAVMFADYSLLRKQHILPGQLYVNDCSGAYWYWGGINWVAFAVIAIAAGCYLSFFDPISLIVSPAFRYVGASVPTFMLSVVLYVVAIRVLRRYSNVGCYNGYSELKGNPVNVAL